MDYIKNKSIRFLLLAFGCLIALPLLCAGFYSSFKQLKERRGGVAANTAEMAKACMLKYDDVIVHAQTMLATLAIHQAMLTDTPAAVRELFLTLIAQYPQYAYLTMTDSEGFLRVSSSSSDNTINFSDRSQFLQARTEKRFAVGETIVSRTTGEAVLPFAAPVLGTDGKVLAVLLLGLKIHWLEQYFRVLNLPENSRVVLFNEQGIRLLRYPALAALPVGEKILSTLWATIRDSQQDIGVFEGQDHVGMNMTYAFVKLRTDQNSNEFLGISVGIPTPAWNSVFWPDLWRIFALLVTTMFLALLIGRVFTRSVLISGIETLAAAAKQLGQGKKLTDLSRLEGCKEIMLLGEAFTSMARSLTAMEEERDRAEKSREKDAQRLRNIIQTSTDAIHILDPIGGVVFCTPSFAHMLGYRMDEIKSLNVSDWDMTWEKEELIRQIGFLFETPRTFVTQYRRKNGSVIDVEISSCVLELEGQMLLYNSARDISERKIFEKELACKSSLILSLLDSAQDIIFLKDNNGTYIGCNHSFLELIDKPRDEIIGKKDHELFNKDIADCFVADSVKVINELKPFSSEGWITCSDDRRCFLETRKTPYWGPDGELIGIIGISRDITDRWRAEEKLRKNEEELKLAKEDAEFRAKQLDSILNAITDGLIVVNPQCQITRMNAAAENIYGYSEAQRSLPLEQRTAEALMMTETGAVVPSEDLPIKRALRGETVTGEVFKYVREAHAQGIWMQLSTAPIRGEGGAILGAVLSVRDISESKKLKDELMRAKEAAETASIAKSEFLAHTSHEIRTPMNAVLGMTELALREDIPPRARRFLLIVRQSGQSLLNIINDILDLSKIEARKVTLQRKVMSIREVLESTIMPLEVVARNKGLVLRYAVDAAVPDRVVGDAGRLRQVLTNVIGNAIKFTETGQVAVTVKLIEDDLASLGRVHLLFYVQDTGIGISREGVEHIFDSFAQENGATHAKYGGTGLGLTIVKELVEMMGGQIGVESEIGKGSLFSITVEFGLAREVQEEKQEVVRTTQKLQPLKILLVEDNLINQLMTEEFLRYDGHSVTTVSNGKEALEELKLNNYDIVLMDVWMPEMSGEEATKRIREGETLDPKVPIVALTANTLEGDRERFLAAGMDDYLSKPVSPEDLNQVLARVITRHGNKDSIF
jgi:two-component system CheB/CheR fusion protein